MKKKVKRIYKEMRFKLTSKKYFNIYSIEAPEPYCEVDIIVPT